MSWLAILGIAAGVVFVILVLIGFLPYILSGGR